jgi:hypothetical protein
MNSLTKTPHGVVDLHGNGRSCPLNHLTMARRSLAAAGGMRQIVPRPSLTDSTVLP